MPLRTLMTRKGQSKRCEIMGWQPLAKCTSTKKCWLRRKDGRCLSLSKCEHKAAPLPPPPCSSSDTNAISFVSIPQMKRVDDRKTTRFVGIDFKSCEECERQEARPAKWDEIKDEKRRYQCSFCKCFATYSLDGEPIPTPFCPWCGSKMIAIRR